MKPKHKIDILIKIIGAIILIIFLTFFLRTEENPNLLKICFPEKCIKAEIADTPEERTQGLMFRESLDENDGMIFIFDDPKVYSFWMKNTLIPLDIIWLNQEKEIVKILQATPCTEDPCEIYNPETEAIYVIEVNQGFTEQNNIKLGDKVDF